MTLYKCEIKSDYPHSENKKCDIIKCYHCDTISEIKGFYDWIDNQTKIKTLKCKKCSKITCVKVFIHTVIKKNDDGQPTYETKYYIYTADELKTRQGRGPQCKGQNCNKPTYTKVINQDRFLNKEIITWQHCGIVSEITATSSSLRDAPKAKIVGEWLSKNRLEQIRLNKVKENLARFDHTHNIKKVKRQQQQNTFIRNVPTIETSNTFNDLPTEVEGNTGTSASSQLDEAENVCDEFESETSIKSKRKYPNSPEILKTSAKRRRSQLTKVTDHIPVIKQMSTAKTSNDSEVQTKIKRLPPIICTNESWLDSAIKFKEISQLAQKHNCDIKFDDDDESSYTEQEVINDIDTRYGLKPVRALPLKNGFHF